MPKTTTSALALALVPLVLSLLAAGSGGAGEEDSSASVPRAVFALAIENREPAQVVERLDSRAQTVFFFTELRGLEGRTVLHRWELDGRTMAEIPFQVRAARWRVYSSKQLDPERSGTWSVSVIDDRGRSLHRSELQYGVAGRSPGLDPARSGS